MVDFSDKQRAMLAKRGLAMPDGGYPIRNRKDLRNAIQAYGRGNSKDDVKRWIKKRAKQLDAEDILPENWRTSMNHSEELYHFGVKGMKLGVRKKRDQPSVKSLRSTASASKMKKQNENYVNEKGKIRSRAALAGRRVAIGAAINLGFSAATLALLKVGNSTLASVAEYAAFGASIFNVGIGIGEQVDYRNALEKSQK